MAFAPSPIVTQKHGTDYQTPSLAVIDNAIMQAATEGDVKRRNGLMTLRVTVALADILGALTAATTDGGAGYGARC